MLRNWCLCLAIMVLISVSTGDLLAQDKKPVPDEKTFKEAKTLVDELYADRMGKLKDQESQLLLLSDILKVARESIEDPISHYALLRLAEEVAAITGDADQYLQVLDELTESYEVKRETLLKAALPVLSKHAARDSIPLAQLYEEMVHASVAENNFVQAQQMLSKALSIARKAKDRELSKSLTELRAQIGQTQREFKTLERAYTTLDKNPGDPKANLEVGRFECFIKGNWSTGLGYLAKGEDETLAGLAQVEMLGPVKPEDQMTLADAWWTQSMKEKGLPEKQIQKHAYGWYKKAYPGLSGLAQKKAELRIAAYEKANAPEIKGKFPRPVEGVITITCDNIFTLMINGKVVAKDVANWTKHETYPVKLKTGDIIAVIAIDQGPGNKTAGMFCSIKLGEEILPSAEGWYYLLKEGPRWAVDRSVKGWSKASLENVHPSHLSRGYPNARGKFFWSSEASPKVYFKFIVP